MTIRPLTLGLGAALVVSLLGNAHLYLALIDTGHGWSDQMSVSRHMRDERAALRELALRLANGEPHRAAFEATLRESGADNPHDTDGWWGDYPLLARFDGDRLADVCWTVWYSGEGPPCSSHFMDETMTPAEPGP